MTDVVQGRFKKVADALAEQITSGSEVGAAIAIDIGGAIEKIFDVQCDGPDVLLLNHPLRWGLGFGLPQRESIPFRPRAIRAHRALLQSGLRGSRLTTHREPVQHVATEGAQILTR